MGPFLIDGVDVFQHEWREVSDAPRAEVRDPLYKQPFSFSVYEITSGAKRIVFAAGEFSNNVWGFYSRPPD
jgi:hypothetical protein